MILINAKQELWDNMLCCYIPFCTPYQQSFRNIFYHLTCFPLKLATRIHQTIKRCKNSQLSWKAESRMYRHGLRVSVWYLFYGVFEAPCLVLVPARSYEATNKWSSRFFSVLGISWMRHVELKKENLDIRYC